MSRPKALTLRDLLPVAQREGYAVGSFSPRYPLMIPPVLEAAEALQSPVIVQISQKDMKRCQVGLEPFAEAFFQALADLNITVPTVLHLDHTEDEAIIYAAIQAGFTSVMIDASEKPLEENIAATRAVADYAHRQGVSVEGELGTIGAFGFSETEAKDEATLTDPEDVGRFVLGSRVDALAVSVGTVHGVREGHPITVDVPHLERIRRETDIPLVLHGGSGIEAEVMRRVIAVKGGGVSKVNLATDLELAMLRALGSAERLTNPQLEAFPKEALAAARAAVRTVVEEKMTEVLLSRARARHYATDASVSHGD